MIFHLSSRSLKLPHFRCIKSYRNAFLNNNNFQPWRRTMYLRAAHAENDQSALLDFIHTNPLGVLTTAIKSESYPFLQSSHIPWVLDLPSSTSTPLDENVQDTNLLDTAVEGGVALGTLRGHVARANPQAKALIEYAKEKGESREGEGGVVRLEEEVLILFTSPVNHYVTPKFYTTTKPSTGKVVPTWNYAAVQVYGTLTIYHDSKSEATEKFLRMQLDDLTKLTEGEIMGFDGKEGRQKGWTVNEAPESYVSLLSKAIIGVEVNIKKIGGKWKMSQELGEGDREGAVKGFKALGTEMGDQVARTIEERAMKKEGK
ncbi:putative FMN-binding domain-containing protein [Tricladium varicosporioides]|nr:putative FMN-binding domain-containing protein [Hymenoscyphus varicosporioides]